jgi:Rieske 2Fe-2S family protein
VDVTGSLRPTLDAGAYLSDEVWATERDRIWFRQWVLVGRDHDLPEPGDRVVVDVAGESIVVVRDDDGTLRGFFNVCRHRGAQLVDPNGPACGSFGAAIQCPYHAWTYGLDGALRRAPFLTADQTPTVSLHPVAIETWGGFVFAHLTPEAATPLAEQLGPIPARASNYPLEELRRGLTFTYDVAANWKTIAENYNECYHCGPVHPTLCDLVPSFRRGGSGLDWPDGIPHREGAWTFTTTGTSNREPFPTLNENERVKHKGELIYPNLLLSLSAEHVAAFRLESHGPSSTTVVCDLLFAPDAIDAPDFDPTDAGDLWDITNREDWAICESVQRGMSSRAWSGGWFAPMEDDTADITVWYARSMSEPSAGTDG